MDDDKNHLISLMRHLRPFTEFRREWQYNNIAYVVASTFPEHLYGVPYERYVEENIFSPLGLGDTMFDVGRAGASGRRAEAFVRTGMDVDACKRDLKGMGWSEKCRGTRVNLGQVPHQSRMFAGPAGVITSAKDMVCHPTLYASGTALTPLQATWLKVLLLQGRSPSSNASVIPSSIISTAAKPYAIPHAPFTDWSEYDLISPKTYGLAQEMYTYRGR